MRVHVGVHRVTSTALVTVLLLLSARAPETDAPLPPDAPVRNWRVPVLHTTGLMLVMRGSLSVLYPRDFDPTRVKENLRHLRDSYSHPPEFRAHAPAFEWDGDPWVLNTVGHGLFGSEVYLRTRQCGHGVLPSLLTAAIASTLWEYGVEAWHKRPSAQDLVWTPLAGALLGEGRFRLHHWLATSGGEPPGGARTVLMFVVDPLGEAERRALDTDC
ncbi:DUF3943 domain-containing protein [Corallococcus sp. H22C18031201]|nr:DUF3943 domain-containing protein [Citreicoccus inhibens]RJS15848.1 DUF3943 domain-containing protein [Corallococcus sp. H22C18031201]